MSMDAISVGARWLELRHDGATSLASDWLPMVSNWPLIGCLGIPLTLSSIDCQGTSLDPDWLSGIPVALDWLPVSTL
jgi:hypothetical protein